MAQERRGRWKLTTLTLIVAWVGGFLFNAGPRSADSLAIAFAASTLDFLPVGGTDTTGGSAESLTASDLTRLSSSNDSRMGSNGNWPMDGAYVPSTYLEFLFSPAVPLDQAIQNVTLTHEYRRSGTLTAAKLQVFESDTGQWHDEPLNLPGVSDTDLSQDISISAYIDTPGDVNGIRIRFLAFRSSSVSSITTGHDLIRLRVVCGDPSTSTHTPSSTLPITLSPTGTPTHSATPTDILPDTATATASPSATGASTATETGTPSPTASASASPTASQTSAPIGAGVAPVVINEVVTDPQTDWSSNDFDGIPGSGSVTELDEFVELRIQADGLDLTGWLIALNDSSPSSGSLAPGGAFTVVRYVGAGAFTDTAAGDYLILGNVSGSASMNDDIFIILLDASGAVADDVEIGSDPESDGTTDGAPDGSANGGNATGPVGEAIARYPDGTDSDDDVHDFVKGAVTLGSSNDAGATPTPVPTSTLTPTESPTPSPSPTSTSTPTPTPTLTATPTATAAAPRAVIFNEVAWAGTLADANDEWIELRNSAGVAVDLAGYTIDDGGDVHIVLSGVIAPGGFFLLERTDDSAIDLPADLIYSGGLSNEGESLTLRDPAGGVVDTVNGDGGAWPAGDPGSGASMERLGDGLDSDSNWVTNFGHVVNGHDKDGNPIRGTPRNANSSTVPTPVPTPLPGGVWLNEFLPHPDSDWDDSGSATSDDEFIEVVNQNPFPVDVSGYMLDDQDGGSRPYVIPLGTVISPGELRAFFRSQTGITLNDDGDSVRLLSPAGEALDAVAYGRDPGADTSWSRLPDGSGDWRADGVPSPARPNQQRVPPPPPPSVGVGEFRRWPDGAWVTVSGRVTVPPATFGSRVVVVQDETGGILLYLGSGAWLPMQPGQQVQAFGYLRTRTGQRELYVRNLWQVGVGPALEPPLPIHVDSGSIGEALEGWLVVIQGPVVRLETNAFWIDDGSGRARVFFGSASGVKRPKVRRGEVWRVVGVVSEYTTRTSKAPGYRLQVRFESDLTQLTDRRGEPLLPVLTGEPEPTDELAVP